MPPNLNSGNLTKIKIKTIFKVNLYKSIIYTSHCKYKDMKNNQDFRLKSLK